MDFRDPGVQTQLKKIEAQTGRPLAALRHEIEAFGAARHAEARRRLQELFGLSFVHADTLLLWVDEQAKPAPPGNPLDSIYVGQKAQLRPIHESFIARLTDWGPYETSPKKGYVSLRRKKQFCMIGPATNSRVAVGINARGLEPDGTLRALPPGKLCQYEVNLATPDDVTDDLLGWVQAGWNQAA
jgi:hypothetical protein